MAGAGQGQGEGEESVCVGLLKQHLAANRQLFDPRLQQHLFFTFHMGEQQWGVSFFFLLIFYIHFRGYPCLILRCETNANKFDAQIIYGRGQLH